MKADLTNIKDVFKEMYLAGFDLKNYLKWGFYFFNKEKSNLQSLSTDLNEQGYTLENLEQMDGQWRLFVTIQDVLSPDELHSRNISFNELALKYNVELYDGWDVEKINN